MRAKLFLPSEKAQRSFIQARVSECLFIFGSQFFCRAVNVKSLRASGRRAVWDARFLRRWTRILWGRREMCSDLHRTLFSAFHHENPISVPWRIPLAFLHKTFFLRITTFSQCLESADLMEEVVVPRSSGVRSQTRESESPDGQLPLYSPPQEFLPVHIVLQLHPEKSMDVQRWFGIAEGTKILGSLQFALPWRGPGRKAPISAISPGRSSLNLLCLTCISNPVGVDTSHAEQLGSIS